MSLRNLTSPILQSNCSLSAEDDNYQFSSPVNEADEIIIRQDYITCEDHDKDGTSVWHDLDRDGVNTPRIPSFILEFSTNATDEEWRTI